MKILSNTLLGSAAFVVLTFACGAAVFAQAVPADPDATPGWASFLITLAGIVGAALLALMKWALSKLFDYLAAKSKLIWLAQVDEYLMAIVTDLYETQITHWKKANADGKLTKEEKEHAKLLAIESLKRAFDPDLLDKLFGDGDEQLANIGKRVELIKTRAQNAGKAARGLPADPTRK